MAILLLMERRKGSSSAVWGYIQQLPDSIDAPVRWSDAELAQLQYQPVIQEVRCSTILRYHLGTISCTLDCRSTPAWLLDFPIKAVSASGAAVARVQQMGVFLLIMQQSGKGCGWAQTLPSSYKLVSRCRKQS
jgi:hypothetical protein